MTPYPFSKGILMFSKVTYFVIASALTYVTIVVIWGIETTHNVVKRTVKDFFSKK